MVNKSMLDVAFEFISSKAGPVSFTDLWAAVITAESLSEEEAKKRLGRFYTNLSLDGRFVTLGENMWDLRTHHTFDKVHIDMNDVYRDVETIDETDEEEKEYIEMLDKETGVVEEAPETASPESAFEKEADEEEEEDGEGEKSTTEIY